MEATKATQRLVVQVPTDDVAGLMAVTSVGSTVCGAFRRVVTTKMSMGCVNPNETLIFLAISRDGAETARLVLDERWDRYSRFFFFECGQLTINTEVMSLAEYEASGGAIDAAECQTPLATATSEQRWMNAVLKDVLVSTEESSPSIMEYYLHRLRQSPFPRPSSVLLRALMMALAEHNYDGPEAAPSPLPPFFMRSLYDHLREESKSEQNIVRIAILCSSIYDAEHVVNGLCGPGTFCVEKVGTNCAIYEPPPLCVDPDGSRVQFIIVNDDPSNASCAAPLFALLALLSALLSALTMTV